MFVIAILSWLACGYLAGFSSGTRLDGLRTVGWEPPTLRRCEVAVALGLVDLLFLGFMIVQFRYLFGGAEMVEVTPGMTYAAYAREGFFQLVVATALGLPWLLVANRLQGNREGPAGWSFRALAGVQLLLLLAIVASAVQRMLVYLHAYGLTLFRACLVSGVGPSFPPAARWSTAGRTPHPAPGCSPFWDEPVSAFGSSSLTTVEAVHICYPYHLFSAPAPA